MDVYLRISVRMAQKSRQIRIHRATLLELRLNSKPFDLPDVRFVQLFRLDKVNVRLIRDKLERFAVDIHIPFEILLLATLHFYGYGSYQASIGSNNIFGLSQPSTSRAIEMVINLINTHLVNEATKFPSGALDTAEKKDGMFNTIPRIVDEYSSDSSGVDGEGSAKENSNAMAGFTYPAFWNNDVLMDPLMGSFRLRTLDPQDYDLKMNFWQDMIAAYCIHKRSASFNKRELQLAFKRKNRIPYGFDTVLEEMLNTKQIRLRNEYEFDPLDTWRGWAVNTFVKKPLKWTIRKIPFIGDGAEDACKIEFIHLGVMKKFSSDLQKYLEQHAGQLLHFDSVLKELQQQLQHTEDSINLSLETLHHQRVVGLEYSTKKNEKRIHFIKIPGKNDPVIEITETNRAVHNLKMTQLSLMEQLESIEDEVKLNEKKARECLKDGKRQLAKTYLRKKQLLERNQEKRSLALHNVETLLCSVDEAQSNGEILGAYKIGSKALQNMLNASGLKYDNVDEVISEIRESIDTHNELNETLANANIMETITEGKCDDDALEQELKEILGESVKAASAEQKPVKSTGATKIVNPTNAVEQKEKFNNNNKTTNKMVITDAELLAMLDNLEVEENSPEKSVKHSQSKVTVNEQM